MKLAALVACILLVAVGGASATRAASDLPRVSLSATTAVAGDALQVRVAPRERPVRVYLVRREVASSIRSRFDPRLRFIAALGPSRIVRTFTVPPLEPGDYAITSWCRGCLPEGRVAIQRRPVLRVGLSAPGECRAMTPNGDAPPRVPRSTWGFHGNGEIAVVLPKTGPLTTNALGGYKMFWVARPALAGLFRVSYRPLDSVSAWVRAETITGTLGGFSGPSWASRMSFEPGCWQIEARVSDVSLGFVAEVVRGTG